MPGSLNALGQVKFMFPNPYHIYLHDTPERSLFSRSDRAFSHGCIRVEEAIELARYLVEHTTGEPIETFDRRLKAGQPHTIRLDRPVPVHLAYLTAWADPDGTTCFYDDAYERDKDLGRGSGARVASTRDRGADPGRPDQGGRRPGTGF
jgi:murein L,D-transpeptidase YcbB/YkuD